MVGWFGKIQHCKYCMIENYFNWLKYEIKTKICQPPYKNGLKLTAFVSFLYGVVSLNFIFHIISLISPPAVFGGLGVFLILRPSRLIC